MNIGRACGIFMNIDSENFTEDEKLVAIRDVLKEMVTYNGITKDNILKAFRWFFDWAVEEASADSGEWIPCSDCLPDDHGTRLVTLSNGTVEGAYYSNDNWWCMSDNTELEVRTNEVIAWMPLPEPYKVGDQE